MISRILPCVALLCFFILYNHLQLAAQAPPGLLDVNWILQSFDNADGSRDTITDHNPTIHLNSRPSLALPQWNSTGGYTACNSWSGSYHLFSTDSIELRTYGLTIVNCGSKALSNLEDRWFRLIAYVQRYELSGNYLRIHYLQPGIDTGTMNFTRQYPLVRYVNLIEGSPGLDLQKDWDTLPRLTGLPYASVSTSLQVDFGPHALRTQYGVVPNKITLGESVLAAYPDSLYTLIAMGGSVTSADQCILSEYYDPSYWWPVEDSASVHLLVASRNLPIERVWLEDATGNVVADFGKAHYGEISTGRLIPYQPLRLRVTLHNDPTEYILTSKYPYARQLTLILQQGKWNRISGFMLSQGLIDRQSILDTLRLIPEGTGALRVVDASPINDPQMLAMSGNRYDTLTGHDATRLYSYHSGLIKIQATLNHITEVVADSISTYIVSWGSQTLPRTPLGVEVSPGETQLRFVALTHRTSDTLDLHIRYASGDTALISDLRRYALTYSSTPSGTVMMSLFKQGEATPRIRVKGILPSGFITAIVSGNIDDDSTLTINLLNETDTAAQKPMTMLERYSPDTTKGWFRTVNVMQGGAVLCTHFAGNDSACLAYRRASHHYENYAGSIPEKIELEWNGRIPITPPAIRPDTLTTLFSLGRAGTHFMISKFLETPLKQPVPSGKAMLRVLNAAYGSDLAYTRLVIDKDEFIDHIMFDEGTIYRSVSDTTARVSLYNSAGILLREAAGNIPAGTYGTLIITGSDDSLGVDLLIDSDSAGQAPLIRFGTVASVETTSSPLHPIRIIPNPTAGLATLKLDAQHAETISLEVFDMTGTVIQMRAEQINVGMNALAVDTQALPAGIYSVVVRDDTGHLHSSTRMVVIR